MNARETVFWIYIIALTIGIVLIFLVLQAIPKVVWDMLPVDKKIEIAGVIGFLILLGICVVLIAYWVAKDAEDLENHQVQFRRISHMLDEIEKRHREENKKKD